jgi:peptide/nickel transport system permease protein
MLLSIVAATIIVPIVSPYGYNEQNLSSFLLPPMQMGENGVHLFGTDSLGRDVFTRVFRGGQISLLVSLISVAGALILGCCLGLLAGYRGGWVDDVVMRLCDLQLAFPLVLLALAVVALLGGSVPIMVAVFVLTIWPVFARTVRGSVLVIREQPFVESAHSIGASGWRVAFKHILPNTLGPVVVVATFQFASVIIYEASLGFLGLGVQPPTPTWGNMMAEGRQFLTSAWWITFFPGFILVLATLSANWLGRGVERLVDPRQREA